MKLSKKKYIFISKIKKILLIILFWFDFLENRPARKNYNKLNSKEDASRSRTDNLDNVAACKEEECSGHETDTDSSFTDLELDDRDDFSDDSDYGMLDFYFHTLFVIKNIHFYIIHN